MLLNLYAQCLAWVVALPLLWALLAEKWSVAVLLVVILLVLVWIPSTVLHSRHIIVRDRSRGRSR